AAVAEQPRHEDGDRDVVRVAARRRHRVAAHRDFGDVELGELEGAVERLLRLEIDRGDVAALDRGASVEDRAGAVVVADREAQRQWHVRLRKQSWREIARTCLLLTVRSTGWYRMLSRRAHVTAA